jgi:hypothetical protein
MVVLVLVALVVVAVVAIAKLGQRAAVQMAVTAVTVQIGIL